MKYKMDEIIDQLEVLMIRYATLHCVADEMLGKLRDNVTHMYELHEIIRESYEGEQEEKMEQVEVKHSKHYH
jgi:uncharacterized lipoprotein YehR (DUF1307 family)